MPLCQHQLTANVLARVCFLPKPRVVHVFAAYSSVVASFPYLELVEVHFAQLLTMTARFLPQWGLQFDFRGLPGSLCQAWDPSVQYFEVGTSLNHSYHLYSTLLMCQV